MPCIYALFYCNVLDSALSYMNLALRCPTCVNFISIAHLNGTNLRENQRNQLFCLYKYVLFEMMLFRNYAKTTANKKILQNKSTWCQRAHKVFIYDPNKVMSLKKR